MKSLATKLNIEQKARGRPRKVTPPVAEPKEPPPPLEEPEELPFEMDEIEDEDNEDLIDILQDIKIEPKKEYTPLNRQANLPGHSPLVRHSLSSLFS
jgi:hypothetical protein